MMEQLELPFKGNKPPVWARCDNCKNAGWIGSSFTTCQTTWSCLYEKGKYTERGGVFFKYYNFFKGKGE